MRALTVLYDACVLYPAPLRDSLMHLAVTDLYRAKWTDAIHEEWIRNLLKVRPDLNRQQLERTRHLMNVHVRDCLVEGYESRIETITLPDPNDRHVLAAAIHAGADRILTFNLKDFPEDVSSPYNIVAEHPDDFVVSQLKCAPQTLCTAARRHRQSLKSPPKTVEQYLTTLASQGLTQTASAFMKFSDLI